MHRRTFLLSATAGILSGAVGLPRFAQAQDRPFTFTSWGGALSDARRRPSSTRSASRRASRSSTPRRPRRARSRRWSRRRRPNGTSSTSAAASSSRAAEEGFLETLDLSKIPNAAALDQGLGHAQRRLHLDGRHRHRLVAPRPSRTAGPQSWKDFWDVKRFPGPRGLYKCFYYNYEAALLAAGVKPRGSLSAHGREGRDRARQDQGAEAPRQGLVERRRPAAAAALIRRAGAVLGLERADACR